MHLGRALVPHPRLAMPAEPEFYDFVVQSEIGLSVSLVAREVCWASAVGHFVLELAEVE